jgi:SPP1 family predicted phage head-tail adaptor
MLDKPIRLEKWESTKDGSGDWKPSTTKYNLWAEVVRQGGSRSNVNGLTSLESTIRFKVWFKPELKVSGNWRVVYNGNRHTVQSIEPENEKRFYLIITASAKSDKG